MRCAECAAEVPRLREFCPKCGAPTDPGLRERRHQLGQPRSTGEMKGNRKKVLIAAAAVLGLGILATGVNIDFDSNDRPPTPDRPEARGPVTIEAEQLYQAYRDNPHGSAERFDGREMVVSGEFLRIVPDGYGSLDLRLKTSNPEMPVGVDVVGIAIDDAKTLRPGQRVTVSCQSMGGYDDDLWVRDCAIQPEGQTSPAPAPAPPTAPASPNAPAPPPAPEAAEGNAG